MQVQQKGVTIHTNEEPCQVQAQVTQVGDPGGLSNKRASVTVRA